MSNNNNQQYFSYPPVTYNERGQISQQDAHYLFEPYTNTTLQYQPILPGSGVTSMHYQGQQQQYQQAVIPSQTVYQYEQAPQLPQVPPPPPLYNYSIPSVLQQPIFSVTRNQAPQAVTNPPPPPPPPSYIIPYYNQQYYYPYPTYPLYYYPTTTQSTFVTRNVPQNNFVAGPEIMAQNIRQNNLVVVPENQNNQNTQNIQEDLPEEIQIVADENNDSEQELVYQDLTQLNKNIIQELTRIKVQNCFKNVITGLLHTVNDHYQKIYIYDNPKNLPLNGKNLKTLKVIVKHNPLPQEKAIFSQKFNKYFNEKKINLQSIEMIVKNPLYSQILIDVIDNDSYYWLGRYGFQTTKDIRIFLEFLKLCIKDHRYLKFLLKQNQIEAQNN